jgi:hypothetical protein
MSSSGSTKISSDTGDAIEPFLEGVLPEMRLSTFVIVVAVLGAAGYGAWRLGHATDEPANQLFTVAGIPQRAAVATAESNLATALAAANSYKLDHSGYAGMTASNLRKGYDAALAVGITVRTASSTAFCMESAFAGTTVSIRGPNGSYVVAPC